MDEPLSKWRCEGCGEEFNSEQPYGHERAAHALSCDGSCRAGHCPVLQQCGPVTEVKP